METAVQELVVLVSGVADPKWPLPREPDLGALLTHAAQYSIPSPFDEAALELALKQRDAEPAVRIVALVAGDEPLARRIAGWRPDAIHRIDLGAVERWNGRAVAHTLARAVRALAPNAALLLVGREFGDWDDGTVPASLAAGLELPYLSLAVALPRGTAGAATGTAVRQGGAGLERVFLPPRAVLSVTNDPGNRLRQPLMKNVMAARKLAIATWSPGDAGLMPGATNGLRLDGVRAAPAPVPNAQGERLSGTAEDKARALAQLLINRARAVA